MNRYVKKPQMKVDQNVPIAQKIKSYSVLNPVHNFLKRPIGKIDALKNDKIRRTSKLNLRSASFRPYYSAICDAYDIFYL